MKKVLEEKIKRSKAVIIPTCDYSWDFHNIERIKKAIEVVGRYNLPKKCVIAGLGLDTNIALGYDKNHCKENLDFHKVPYDYLMQYTDWMIGLDCFSMNSIENILNVFPEGIKGIYPIVSYPSHLRRFKKIIKDAKKAGKISDDIKVIYIPTRKHPERIFYEILANIKYHIKGKQKYFSKKST